MVSLLLSDHDLRQIDEGFIKTLDIDSLRNLTQTLLVDLKELKDRQNQNASNSSTPPSSRPIWDRESTGKSENDLKAASNEENEVVESEENQRENPSVPNQNSKEKKSEQSKNKRNPGRQVGAKGHGRTQKLPVNKEEFHNPTHCSCCSKQFSNDSLSKAYTAYYSIDIAENDEGTTGIFLENTKHYWMEKECSCGHKTRAIPGFQVDDPGWSVSLSTWRLIGPKLASYTCFLHIRMRLSREKIREHFHDWFGLHLSIGVISQCIHEAGRAASPVNTEVLNEIEKSSLVHADETGWIEAAKSCWFWVFISLQSVYFVISSRSKKTPERVLGRDFTGWLMADGYSSYRWYDKRLRCWAHLIRKAKGLEESFDNEASNFGKNLGENLKVLVEMVYEARDGPCDSLFNETLEITSEIFKLCETHQDSLHEKTASLSREFMNDWDAIFQVLENPAQPLTNNIAERALRHWVISRRIMYGTKNEQGSRVIATLATLIETCRLRSSSPWRYLEKVIVNARKGNLIPQLPKPAISQS